MTLLKGLPPIIDAQARILILGSFPSEASLAARHYYAHKQNQFWRILGAVIDQPLVDMDYAAKQAAVKAAGIAIWDVYASCERPGSLDSAIRNGQPNDFAALRKSAVAVRRACFNGQAAGRFAPQLEALGFETIVLPSTSPANASWSFGRKLAAWRAALQR
ncbi:MAG TPA: DNA-deoxyinosine glycosylase [Rhodocyclaceae bacterium]|nr:DNA-deoxyinosine glycosylase [Rhodocyclaceae bacterium]